ncbi:MAG: COP23 domain-containing protein [Geitlerinemataceae cyanobacterium]
MKLALSISALAASTVACGISMASPAAAQLPEVTQQVNVEKVCHDDICVEVQVEQSVNPSGENPTAVYPQVEVMQYPEEGVSVYETYPGAYPVAEPISYEGGDMFFCGSNDYGSPTTYVDNGKQSLPLISWVSHYFSGSGYDPLTRCEQVTERFNRFYQEGRLNFITTGIVNRQPVVCVSGYIGGPCTDVLFTLKPGEDAAQAVQQLFDVRVGEAGPLYESGSRMYFDLNERLSELSSQ